MAEGQDIINLGVGSPDLAPAEGVVDAVCRGAGVRAPSATNPTAAFRR